MLTRPFTQTMHPYEATTASSLTQAHGSKCPDYAVTCSGQPFEVDAVTSGNVLGLPLCQYLSLRADTKCLNLGLCHFTLRNTQTSIGSDGRFAIEIIAAKRN